MASTYNSYSANSHSSRYPAIDFYFDEKREFCNLPRDKNYPVIFFLDNNQQVVYSINEAVDSVDKLFILARQIKNRDVVASSLYFDERWWPVPAAKASFYRKTTPETDGLVTIRDYYKNGILQMEGKVTLLHPAVREGKYVYFNPDGKKEEAFYVRNQLQGESTAWYSDGAKKYNINYQNNLRQGPYVSYYKNGKTAFSVKYENDQRVGKWTVYHPNGKKATEATYIWGKLQGHSTGWYANANLKHEVDFVNNFIDHTKNPRYLHENGVPLFSATRQGNDYRHVIQTNSILPVVTVRKPKG